MSTVAMRVVGVDSYRDEDDDGGLANTRRYNAYIDSVRPSLPPTVSSLLDVSVHDSLVVSWTASSGQFEMTFVTENIVEGISRIRLGFTEADIFANDNDTIETLRLTDGSTVLLTSEFDVVTEGRYRYQIMMTPTGELAITFSDVTIDRSPATIEEYEELGRRPNTGRWGRQADAWLEELPALHRAAALGDIAGVSELLASGASVDEVDLDTGWTALHAAAQRIQIGVMKLLIDAGARFDVLSDYGQTPLDLAARDSDWHAVEFLVRAGANVNFGGDEHPLSEAAGNGNMECMRLLIAAGADPNHVDSEGWSALMVAAERKESAAVDVLLAAGADPTLQSHDGESAADIARARGYADLAKTLAEAVTS